MRVAVVVPLKSFALAKGRLSDVLSDDARGELARTCAAAVILAAGSWPVYVACETSDVQEWSEALGARCVRTDVPGAIPGLDAAVARAVAAATEDGADHVVVAHGDLPLARSFAHVPIEGSVSLIGDRRGDGTNVLSFPVASPMRTAYGPGSLERHRGIAEGAGLTVVMIDDPDLALDLDTAEDLDHLRERRAAAHREPSR